MIHPSHPVHVDGEPADAVDKSGTSESTLVAPKHGGGALTGAVHRPQDTHYDPAGKPVKFTDSSMRDQQAGGDLSGREPETRDDNFIDHEAGPGAALNRQSQRDIGTGIDDFSESKTSWPERSKSALTRPAPDKKPS
jgi:hypothetical protein